MLGAVLSNKLADRLSDVQPVHWTTPAVLALVVWVIYTLDRLLDIRKPGVTVTPRHQFHREQAPYLWQGVIGAAALAGLLAFWLPASVLRFGAVLGLLCALYVAGVYRLPADHPAQWLKEPLVALLFAAGVWGSIWVQRPAVTGVFVAEGVMFTAIAFQNLLLFSVMEKRETPQLAPASLAQRWGEVTCDRVLRWLTFGVVATALGICFLNDGVGASPRFAQRAALMLGIMSITLYVIQRYPAYFLRHERYRWLGDAVFWLPALVL